MSSAPPTPLGKRVRGALHTVTEANLPEDGEPTQFVGELRDAVPPRAAVPPLCPRRFQIG